MPPPPPDTELDQTATEYFGPEFDDGESSTLRLDMYRRGCTKKVHKCFTSYHKNDWS